MGLTAQQIEEYKKDGYASLRGVLSKSETDELRKQIQANLGQLSYPAALKYPTPGKYTISGNSLAEPGFAPIAEHPTVVEVVEILLGEPAHLTAYVAYLRSPGDKGSGAHSDYKRWRPVGSSMNWLFTIIPLTDFNDDYGPLLVSPGSHLLSDVIDRDARIWDVPRPDAKQLADFVDPELQAGDVLLLHGHTWHKAPAGTGSEDRVGIFNKYCGVSAPPAAGYYPYTSRAVEAMSDGGQRLIPRPIDQPIQSTRLLIEDGSSGESRYMVVNDQDGTALPGGEGWEEEDVGWDVGARIGSLQGLVKEQIGIEIPWMTYIGDVEEGSGACRLYGFVDDQFDGGAIETKNIDWLTGDAMVDALGTASGVQEWERSDLIRGMGKAIAQRKSQFE